ncbi:hypothetical protein [Pengzhenrongella sicca]|uniref:Uncharacterized protein n=1 Tax=Pengzhenrongella sicca TaxID=2819238 RepID=A0A8A4ZC34_9MICO|nr:hypothetical protein [Pengzhenrongella sicca]QTE28569.1 hypothetical protein J4E96_14515 [Pengzhenrongella sicca]
MTSIEALGTWIGGIATAAAVIVAASQLNGELKRQRTESDRAHGSETRITRLLAEHVALRFKPLDLRGAQHRKVSFDITNKNDEAIENFKVSVTDTGAELGHAQQIYPGRSWSCIATVVDLSISVLPAQENEAGRILKQELRPKICLEFTTRGRNFRKVGDSRVQDVTSEA